VDLRMGHSCEAQQRNGQYEQQERTHRGRVGFAVCGKRDLVKSAATEILAVDGGFTAAS
jgi:hypothetical protein